MRRMKQRDGQDGGRGRGGRKGRGERKTHGGQKKERGERKTHGGQKEQRGERKERGGRDGSAKTEAFYAPPGKTPAEDTAAVMKFYGLKADFPKAVRDEAALVQAAGAGAGAVDATGRLDLRRKFIFTCDPVTARDYDDALSLEKDRRGRRVLGVHIADVSHYVRPGSAIDKEAYKRSTSVYLIDRVVPMLPEVLSNGLCSLVPGEDRLTFSVFLTFDREGNVVKTAFAKSVIRSKARYTYEQVMNILQGEGRTAKGRGLGAKVRGLFKIGTREARTLRDISALAQQMRAKRFALGALDLNRAEISLTLDGEGMMTGLESHENDESHQMIEECMVAANEAVAKELWTHDIKILARFHDSPDPRAMYDLRAEAQSMGVKCGDLTNRKVFSQFMQTVKRHPARDTLTMMILRSMQKAVYDSANMGHWGLAKRFYAHFTSPIRRYPDLTLHRQLAAYLAHDNAARVPAATLRNWAGHTSEMEVRATEAERALLEIKKYRVLEEELNARMPVEYTATIVSCQPFGCFVEIPELAVSGLVHVSRLARRYVKFNESDHTLSAVGGGGSWRIGDTMKVVVTNVDFAHRKLDFVPVESANRPANRRRRT